MPDGRVIQRRALLQRLGLPTSHYLRLQPDGHVNLQALLNASAICMMPDHLAYHWWAAPAASATRSRAEAGSVVGSGVGSEPRPGPGAGFEGGPEARTGVGPRARAAVKGGVQPSQIDIPGHVEVKGIAWVTNAAPPPLTAPQPASASASGSLPQASTEAHKDAPDSPVVGSGGPFGCSPLHVQLAVTGSLRKLLQSKLQAIAGGSAEEDKHQTSDPQCTPAAQMALQYRADQKRIAAAASNSLTHVVTAIVCRTSKALVQVPNNPMAKSQEPAKVLQCLKRISCCVTYTFSPDD